MWLRMLFLEIKCDSSKKIIIGETIWLRILYFENKCDVSKNGNLEGGGGTWSWWFLVLQPLCNWINKYLHLTAAGGDFVPVTLPGLPWCWAWIKLFHIKIHRQISDFYIMHRPNVNHITFLVSEGIIKVIGLLFKTWRIARWVGLCFIGC